MGEPTEHSEPGSVAIAAVASFGVWRELSLLVSSVRVFETHRAIYVGCDARLMRFAASSRMALGGSGVRSQ